MSFTIIDAENAWRQWAEAITGIPFYFTFPSTGKPNGLFGAMRFIVLSVNGTPIVRDTPEEISGEPWVKHETDTCIIGTLSINVYREGARQAISDLQNSTRMQGPYEILQLVNIGFVRFGASQDLTQDVEAQMEERAQIDATFNLVGYTAEDINTIDNVVITNLSAGISSEVTV